MATADLSETDPEALTLFGRPPALRRRCPGCGLRAEPYFGLFCWLCFATGMAKLMLAQATDADQDLLMGEIEDADALTRKGV